ncbi:sugar kinase [Saccharopolyspora sp. ASAGF58]|uniref:sugar kinase n=1 Tax=Saccharopolyspora sp. ASAGF58 TaxID=2719023 RepID=UPI00143FCB39|nr:sugar kinase [Saccharopolyspora sp. ASAGF58]QIZ37306.1 sugar kinase [Saccharopolyspora sp. ASAGF58]
MTTADELDLVAVGETMVMVTPEPGGRLDTRSSFILRPGGAESNVAALLAKLGHRSAWASAVGTDPLGDIIMEFLNGQGVDVDLVRRDERRPTAVYFKDPAPSGTKVYYYRTGSAASAMNTSDVAAWTRRPARIVHISGITAAISADGMDVARHVVSDRPFGPALVSFDVNHRPNLWTNGAAELRALAQRSDIVFVGRDEAEALWGTSDVDSVRDLLDEPTSLIVKDGATEAVAFTPAGVFREPSIRTDVVDAVGAGDAFAAGWLSGLLDDRDEVTRLRLGHYVASRVLASPSDFAELLPAREIVGMLDSLFDEPNGEAADDPRSDDLCRRP